MNTTPPHSMRIGSLYYSGEGYDDFYYGKGSTYPDIHGCVGILFEQASSRGHLQQTDNGLLSFPFTVRNQVATAMSTLEAFGGLRDELLTYQRDFNAKYSINTGYVVDADGDQGRARELLNILNRHTIPVRVNTENDIIKEIYVEGTPASRAFFEPITEFEDSLFYDVSTFVLPYAFNLPYRTVTGGPPNEGNWGRGRRCRGRGCNEQRYDEGPLCLRVAFRELLLPKSTLSSTR